MDRAGSPRSTSKWGAASLAFALGLGAVSAWADDPTSEGGAAGAAKAAGSTVEIIRRNDGHLGAGVQIEPGLILTAAHVVATERNVLVRDDQGRELIGQVEEAIAGVDLAFVTVRTPSNMKVSPLSCREPPVGMPIEIVGHPFGREFVVMTGAVAEGVQRVGEWPSLVILTKNAFPGMSGGPVLGADGRVVAMVVAATDSARVARKAGAVPGSVICRNLPGVQASS
ncbi:MAG: serine protease [Bauldia sp.]